VTSERCRLTAAEPYRVKTRSRSISGISYVYHNRFGKLPTANASERPCSLRLGGALGGAPMSGAPPEPATTSVEGRADARKAGSQRTRWRVCLRSTSREPGAQRRTAGLAPISFLR
jgi:hypothetical protein